MTSCFICIEHFSFRFLFFPKTIIHFFHFFSNFGSYGNCLLFLFLFLISFYIFVLILYALYHSFQVLFFNNHLLLTHYSLELFKVSVIHYIKGIPFCSGCILWGNDKVKFVSHAALNFTVILSS